MKAEDQLTEAIAELVKKWNAEHPRAKFDCHVKLKPAKAKPPKAK